MLVFEDEETTTITQKPCVRKSMSFEGEQRRIEYNGSRKKEVFSVHKRKRLILKAELSAGFRVATSTSLLSTVMGVLSLSYSAAYTCARVI
jgi:hypothetical protein